MYNDEFIITNQREINTHLPIAAEYKSFTVYTRSHNIHFEDSGEKACLIVGNVLFTSEISCICYSNNDIAEFVIKNTNRFITRLKGDFTIIIFERNKYTIYSDRFAIRKFFYWMSNSSFIISNNISAITRNTETSPSKEHIAIYALVYHFINGITIFKNIYHNTPAQIVAYDGLKLSFSSYWDILSLLQGSKKQVDIEDMANELINNLTENQNQIKEDPISLSLTAGIDSRILLSILLSSNRANIHTFTYGNPASIDCVIARKISEQLGIKHSTYNIKFNETSFFEASIESISVGNSLGSLHRAHRIKAIELESEFSDTLILGTMGGEFVKGTSFDNYIISSFIYAFILRPSPETIQTYLISKGVNPNLVDIEYILDFFNNQNWLKHHDNSEFYLLFEISLGLHHAQNNFQLDHKFQKILTPFDDYDYLRLLFDSRFSFLHKRKYSTSFRQRLENHHFGSKMQTYLNPELAKIPYNSGFTAEEYLSNKIVATVKSRIRKYNWDNPPNFTLDEWMYEFTKNELTKLKNDTSTISELFDLDMLLFELKNKAFIPRESFWVKYTTPIQMAFTLHIFS